MPRLDWGTMAHRWHFERAWVLLEGHRQTEGRSFWKTVDATEEEVGRGSALCGERLFVRMMLRTQSGRKGRSVFLPFSGWPLREELEANWVRGRSELTVRGLTF